MTKAEVSWLGWGKSSRKCLCIPAAEARGNLKLIESIATLIIETEGVGMAADLGKAYAVRDWARALLAKLEETDDKPRGQ